jgi:hypothetical protein
VRRIVLVDLAHRLHGCMSYDVADGVAVLMMSDPAEHVGWVGVDEGIL